MNKNKRQATPIVWRKYTAPPLPVQPLREGEAPTRTKLNASGSLIPITKDGHVLTNREWSDAIYAMLATYYALLPQQPKAKYNMDEITIIDVNKWDGSR